MNKRRQTGEESSDGPEARSASWQPPRGIQLIAFAHRPARPYGVQWRIEGRRKTKTFPTREKQIEFARAMAGDVKRDGLAAYRLNESEARKWRAFRAVIGADADLEAVAAVWEKHKAVQVAPHTVREAAAAYTAAKTAEGVDPATVAHYRPIFDRLEAVMGERNAGDVTGEEIAAFMAMQNGSDQTRRTRFNRIRALFNWLLESKRIISSPFAGMRPPKITPKEVEILSLAQSKSLFAKNAANEDGSPISRERRETLGRLALEAFCGLRNDTAGQIVAAEIQPGGLRIPAAKIKTRKDQFLDGLPKNLLAWLKWSRPEEWGMTQRQYAEAKADAFTRAGVPHPHNCLRHGFASYHVAAFKNPAATSVLLCHKSAKLLWDTYRGIATQPDGLAYFAIKPPAGKGADV